jgi:glycine/D-amino acid oxidase-like deaminating enzyme
MSRRRGDGAPETVAVVGAGAVGLTTAAELAERGATVTVYERGEPGSGSSGRAAGVCYDAYAEDVDAAIGRRAVTLFRDLASTVEDDEGSFAFHDCPYVFLAREGDDRTAEAIAASVDRMRAHGVDVSTVDPGTLPAPVRTDDVAVAAVARNAGWLDPAAYVASALRRAREAGTAVRTGTPVSVDADGPGVRTGRDPGSGHGGTDGCSAADRYDAVIVAAGAHTKRLLAGAGVAIPLKPYRVQALTSATPYDGPMVFDATTDVYLRPHPTGLLAGDGTVPVEADLDDWRRAADESFVASTRGELRHRVRHDLDVADAWAGLCTATPDGDPLVGECSPGLYVAAGWQGHGLMRAPAIGERLARTVLGAGEGGAAGEGVPDTFSPSRFEGDEEFAVVQGMTVEPPDGATEQ